MTTVSQIFFFFAIIQYISKANMLLPQVSSGNMIKQWFLMADMGEHTPYTRYLIWCWMDWSWSSLSCQCHGSISWYITRYTKVHTAGLAQDCSNSSALAMELLWFCTYPLIYFYQNVIGLILMQQLTRIWVNKPHLFAKNAFVNKT